MADPLAEPTVRGGFPVAEDGRELVILCWGEGSPTIVLEAGSQVDGIGQFFLRGRPLLEELAVKTRVCTYDRAGSGLSDPPPYEPRDADDLTLDLRTLLTVAGVEPPYVLVGSSFGGFVVTWYAARYPEDVAGVVMLDTPAPNPALTLDELPELAWDHPDNPERIEFLAEFETRLATDRRPFAAPLTVVTATGGQSTVEDQAFWLELSPEPRQVGIVGGHEVYNDDPQGVAAEILALTENAGTGAPAG